MLREGKTRVLLPSLGYRKKKHSQVNHPNYIGYYILELFRMRLYDFFYNVMKSHYGDPAPAVRKLVERTGVAIGDVDIWEANEAFAAQALSVVKELGLDPEKVNPNGSGISLGHPIGATGAMLTVKALYELERIQGRYAVVTMCIGGGQGIATLFERCD